MTITYLNPQIPQDIRDRTEKFFALVSRETLAEAQHQALLGLIRLGICLDARESNGTTPLHDAAMNGHTNAVEALLAHSAEIEAKTNYGRTPLHYAAWDGHKDVVEALLAHSAAIEAKTNGDYTPLHYAAWDGHKDVVEALLARGANIHGRNDEGVTSIDYLSIKLPDIKIAPYQERYAEFAETGTPPRSAYEVYELLCAWPLIDPDAPVDRAGHLRQLFVHAKWESPEQAERIADELRSDGEDPVLCGALRDMARPLPKRSKWLAFVSKRDEQVIR